jgi:hypothetical protein
MFDSDSGYVLIIKSSLIFTAVSISSTLSCPPFVLSHATSLRGLDDMLSDGIFDHLVHTLLVSSQYGQLQFNDHADFPYSSNFLFAYLRDVCSASRTDNLLHLALVGTEDASLSGGIERTHYKPRRMIETTRLELFA